MARQNPVGSMPPPLSEHIRLVSTTDSAEGDAKPANTVVSVVLSSTIGNVLEWYDFSIFAFLAPQIGSNFFPESDKLSGIMNAFIVFGGGFVVRPVGGMLFGHIGDRHGRMKALGISVWVMALATFSIGCLPTYAQIGPWAPLLLTLCRLLQGLSVGGEMVGSMVYAVEAAPRGRETLMGSLCNSSGLAGTTLGSWTGLLLHSTMSREQLDSFGWRIPLWGGLVIGLYGAWVRRGLQEAEAFRQSQQQRKEVGGSPVLEGLRREPVTILLATLIVALHGFSGWFLTTFAPVLYLELMDPPLSWDGRREGPAVELEGSGSRIWLLHTLVCSAVVPCIAVFGWLGDWAGNQTVMVAGALSMVVAAGPGCMGMGSGKVGLAIMGQAGLALIYGCVAGNLPRYLVRLFPVEVRFSCLSIAWNVALALFGGTAGMVATVLYGRWGSMVGIAAYLGGVAGMAASAVLVQNWRTLRRERRELYRDASTEKDLELSSLSTAAVDHGR